MSNNSGGKTLAFFLGLLFGALLGGGLGLILAPDKGETTRKKLKRKSEEIKEKVDEIYQDLKDVSQPLVEAVEEFGPVVEETEKIQVKEPTPVKEEIKEKLTAISGSLGNAKKRFFKNTRR